MTGNDIVDLATASAESNWRRTGFLEKIFTPPEQYYINHASAPDQVVWRLWTMKESAYKVYTRQHGGRFFAPQKLSCVLLGETTGLVTVNGVSYQTTTTSTKDYIYSTARLNRNEADFVSHCFKMPPDHPVEQSFIYKKIVAHYAAIQQGNGHHLLIKKDKENIPYLYCKEKKLTFPVSITHHGNYAAFTIN